MTQLLTFSSWSRPSSLNENIKAAKSYLIKKYLNRNIISEITT